MTCPQLPSGSTARSCSCYYLHYYFALPEFDDYFLVVYLIISDFLNLNFDYYLRWGVCKQQENRATDWRAPALIPKRRFDSPLFSSEIGSVNSITIATAVSITIRSGATAREF